MRPQPTSTSQLKPICLFIVCLALTGCQSSPAVVSDGGPDEVTPPTSHTASPTVTPGATMTVIWDSLDTGASDSTAGETRADGASGAPPRTAGGTHLGGEGEAAEGAAAEPGEVGADGADGPAPPVPVGGAAAGVGGGGALPGSVAGISAARTRSDAGTDRLSIASLPATGRAGKPEAAAAVLTAGSFDDTLNIDAYMGFATRFGPHAVGPDAEPGTYPAEVLGYPTSNFDIAAPLILHIVDTAGLGVPDARVSVYTPGGDPLMEALTRASGRVVVLPGVDGPADLDRVQVVVEVPGSSEPVTGMVPTSTKTRAIEVPDAKAPRPKQLDLAFVIDATGSMGDEMEYLKLELDGIVAEVSAAYPDVDQRYALVVYRDEGDAFVSEAFDFSSDLDAYLHRLAAQSADGGGDTPEAVHRALSDAADLSWRTSGTARVAFLVADAPPHVEHADTTMEAFRRLRSQGVAVYPVAASGVDPAAEIVFRTGSLLSAGQYVFLTDDSGVGNPHAEPHIPCYDVEHLNDTVVRMIATELIGRYIAAAEASVIRSVGHSADGVCVKAPVAEPGATATPQQ